MPILIGLGGLDVVIMGLLALLLLLAFEAIRRPLSNLLSHLPLIGHLVADWVESALTAAWEAVYSFWESVVGNFDAFVTALYLPVQAIADATSDVFVAIAQHLGWILDTLIPASIAAVYSWAWGLLQSAFNDIEATGNQVRAWAWGLLQSAFSDIAISHAQANSYTDTRVGQAEAQATAQAQAAAAEAIATAKGYSQEVESWVQTIVADIQSGATASFGAVTADLQALEQYIAQGIGQAEQYAESATAAGLNGLTAEQAQRIQAALAPMWPGLAADANTAAETLTLEHPGVLPGVTSVPVTVPLDAAAAIAGLSTIAQTLATTVNDCALPMCNEKIKLGSQLKNLESLLGGGILLAFIAEAVLHPAQVARDTEAVAGDVVKGIRDAVHGIIS